MVRMSAWDTSEPELCGNALCLDFANTVNTRRHPVERDHLATYPDLRRWLAHVGTPTPAVGAADRPAVLGAAHELRDVIYRAFSAVAAGRPVAAADLRRLGDAYGHAVSTATIAPRDGGGYHLVEAGGRPLWAVELSAGDLLLTGDPGRIRECPSCGWLFLDTSRNGNRRWCSMATCGSRDKMARYYRRSHP